MDKSEWLREIIEEMIDAGLVEEVEPGVVQKLGGHGWKLAYDEFDLGDVDPDEIDRDNFKITLLALMTAPHIMGQAVEERDEMG